MDKYQKPVIIFNHHTDAIKGSIISTRLKENGVMTYPTPERAVRVLAHLVEYSRYLSSEWLEEESARLEQDYARVK